jgi:hypothetical protein
MVFWKAYLEKFPYCYIHPCWNPGIHDGLARKWNIKVFDFFCGLRLKCSTPVDFSIEEKRRNPYRLRTSRKANIKKKFLLCTRRLANGIRKIN